MAFLQFLRVDLDQRNVLAELLRVPFQNFCNRHVRYLKNLSVFYKYVFSDPFNIQQQSRISSKYTKKNTAERQTPEEDAAVPPRQRRLAPQRRRRSLRCGGLRGEKTFSPRLLRPPSGVLPAATVLHFAFCVIYYLL